MILIKKGKGITRKENGRRLKSENTQEKKRRHEIERRNVRRTRKRKRIEIEIESGSEMQRKIRNAEGGKIITGARMGKKEDLPSMLTQAVKVLPAMMIAAVLKVAVSLAVVKIQRVVLVKVKVMVVSAKHENVHPSPFRI